MTRARPPISCDSERVLSRWPLVSIGVASYNDAELISGTLSSLLGQSVRDLEIVVSDDASTDGSAAKCAAVAREDARVRFFRQERNLGMVENFNFLLRAARGQYFMWAASDDTWDAHYVERLLEALAEHPRAVGAFSAFSYISPEGARGQRRTVAVSSPSRLVRIARFCLDYEDIFFYGLYRREALLGTRFRRWWWPNRGSHLDIVYPVAFHILSRGDVALVGGEPLFFKRMRGEGFHFMPFDKGWRIYWYLSFVLRQANVFFWSSIEVWRGSGSLVTLLSCSPLLASRLAYNCLVVVPGLARLAARRTLERALGADLSARLLTWTRGR